MVIVAQLRAVPVVPAFGELTIRSSAAARSLRPYPSGVCRYRVRPTTRISSLTPLAADCATAASSLAVSSGPGGSLSTTACTRRGSGSSGNGLAATTSAELVPGQHDDRRRDPELRGDRLGHSQRQRGGIGVRPSR